MSSPFRIALTADLHWGSHRSGDAATGLLVDFLRAEPPDVLVLAGDLGAGDHFGECLDLFDWFTGPKLCVPGNHDVWVSEDDPRGDSLAVYREHLPRACSAHGFHYLDGGPFVWADAGVAFVGSMNWYDHSWAQDELRRRFPRELDRLRTKVFTRGRHNDARFVRWPFNDQTFTAEAVRTLEEHLRSALEAADRAVVVTHHPPFYGLTFPRPGPSLVLDELLWDAFSGNRGLEEMLSRYAERVPFAFCGHTHRARENSLGPIRGYNIGGDYHFKRLLLLALPAGTAEAHEFGAP